MKLRFRSNKSRSYIAQPLPFNLLMLSTSSGCLLTVALLLSVVQPVPVFAQKPPLKTEMYNDDFVRASYLELQPFLTKYHPTLLSKQRRVNEHDLKQIDYILTYALGQDKFIFYKIPSKALIISFTATSSKLKLAKGICIGMRKQEFEKAFEQKVAGNMATVAETEQVELYTFTFTHDRLTRIAYQCRID